MLLPQYCPVKDIPESVSGLILSPSPTKVLTEPADGTGIKRGQLEGVLGGVMSISSLLGLAERLFSGETGNSAGTQNVQQQEKPQHLHAHRSRHQHEQNSVEGDRFTPSSTTNATSANDNAVALQFERLRLSTFAITATTPAASGGTPTPSPIATSVAPATTTAPAATSSGTTVPSAGQAQASAASIPPASNRRAGHRVKGDSTSWELFRSHRASHIRTV